MRCVMNMTGDAQKTMADRLILKKYPNRRLYDTEQSSYVTLNQVADIVKKGREIQVLDAKTEEDVTAFILSQIIMEEARNRNNLLPVSLLHLIIQYGENVLNEFFEKYLELAINNYLAYRKAYEEQFKKWLEMGMDLSAFNAQKMSPFAGINSFLDIFPQVRGGKPPNEPARSNKMDTTEQTDQ